MGEIGNFTRTRGELKLANKANLIIPKKVQQQIDYLHEVVGNIEWSGMLLTEIEGSLDNISALKVKVQDIFLCDVGTAAGTSYDNSDHIEALWEKFPDYSFTNTQRWDGKNNLKGVKLAQIHTHHTLSGGAYFSGVDLYDLDVNASAHGLYISLIVDAKGVAVAKGAFVCEIEEVSNILPKDFTAVKLVAKNKVEKLVSFDFDIQKPNVLPKVDSWFVDRHKDILELKRIEAENKRLAAEKLNKAQQFIPGKHRTLLPLNNKSKHNNFKHHNSRQDTGFTTDWVPGLGNISTNDITGISYYEDGNKLKGKDLEIFQNWLINQNLEDDI